MLPMFLPIVAGWETTRRLKTNMATHDIPTIALTALAMAGRAKKALAASCYDFDARPVDVERPVQESRTRVPASAPVSDRNGIRRCIHRLCARPRPDRRCGVTYSRRGGGALLRFR